MKTKNDELLMASGAAKILNRSAECVRFYERTGKLRAIRTADGTRLFRRTDVEKFLRDRDQADTETKPAA
jgi:DNA-binding transcriptional MerR regulator